jgi:hypothetical protein
MSEDSITIRVSAVRCPRCGATEMHPNGRWLLIRGFKVHDRGRWWSQCLVCAGYYNSDLTLAGSEWDRPDGGWF